MSLDDEKAKRMMQTAFNYINLKDYPIDQDNDQRLAILKAVKKDLARDGCAVLKKFLTEVDKDMFISF